MQDPGTLWDLSAATMLKVIAVACVTMPNSWPATRSSSALPLNSGDRAPESDATSQLQTIETTALQYEQRDQIPDATLWGYTRATSSIAYSLAKPCYWPIQSWKPSSTSIWPSSAFTELPLHGPKPQPTADPKRTLCARRKPGPQRPVYCLY